MINYKHRRIVYEYTKFSVGFFNCNIFQKPAFFVGLLVLIGYALLKKPIYDCLSGFVKATVGYMILAVGSGGLVSNFRPILLGLATRFNLTAAVIDPYYGQIAAEHLIEQVGRSVSIGMSVLILGFFINIALVYFKKASKVRSLMITGHTMICQTSVVTWLMMYAFPNASDLQIIIMTGVLMGFYWGATTNLTVEPCQNLTNGAGFVVGHNQMFGVWLADTFGEKIGGKNSKKVEDIELPGWLGVLKENTVSSGISSKLLPGSAAGIDFADTFGFIPQNAIMLGFLCGLAGQVLVILGLVFFKSPVLVITGFVPVFFDNATIAGFANNKGGVKAVIIICFLSGVLQAGVGAFAAKHFLTATFGGWYGNFDFEFFWPWIGLLLENFRYVGLGIALLICIVIPQIQYKKYKENYWRILTDYSAVKAEEN